MIISVVLRVVEVRSLRFLTVNPSSANTNAIFYEEEVSTQFSR